MADEIKEVQEVDESPQGEESKTTDWKAEARKWERLAKKAHSAEVELEQLKQSQMTEQEREKARADAAEAELQQLKAEKAKLDAATRLASDTGVPFEMLMYCADEDAMTDFAKTYAQATHVASAPTALGGSRIIRGNDKPQENREVFAEFAEKFFK